LEEEGPISSVAFAGGGRFAVVQTQESGEFLTSVWDIRTAQLSRRLAGFSRVSPDGKFLLTARIVEGQSWLEVRDVFSGCLRREFHLEGAVVSDTCFSTDGRFLAAVTLGGDFLLYEFDEDYRVLPEELLLTNTRGGQDLEENRARFLKHLRAAQDSFEEARYLESREHLQLARGVGGYRRDPQARALTRQLGRHLGRGDLLSCWEVRLLGSAGGMAPSPIVLIPNTDLMLTANEKILRLWNNQQGSCIRGFPGHSEAIRSIDVNADGTRAVSGSLDRGIRCWDLQTGTSLGRVSLSKGGAMALHWVPGTARVVALTNQHSLCGVDVEEYQEVYQVPATGISWMLGLKKHNQIWLGGPVQPGLLQIVDGLSGKVVRKPSQWKLSAAAGGESALLADVAVLYGDGHYGITAGREGKIHLWDLLEGRHLSVLLNIESEVSCMAISGDGLVLAVGLENGWVQIWDLQKKLLCQIIEGPWDRLASLALSPDGCELHILGCDSILRTWEMEWQLQEFVSQSNLVDTLPKGSFFSRLWKGWKK
jgi:WD40 repeat protein